MNKTDTLFLNRIARYLNTFNSESLHPAFASQTEIVKEALSHIDKKDGGKVNFLDLGCGLGNVLFTAKEVLGEGKYVGIEHNPAYVELSRFIDSSFHIIDIDLLSQSTRKLLYNADVVYCYLPIPQYDKMQELYRMIQQSTKPGTYFLCNAEHQPKLQVFKKIKRFEGYSCCDKTDITLYYKDALA